MAGEEKKKPLRRFFVTMTNVSRIEVMAEDWEAASGAAADAIFYSIPHKQLMDNSTGWEVSHVDTPEEGEKIQRVRKK
jgi:hypothetical protein